MRFRRVMYLQRTVLALLTLSSQILASFCPPCWQLSTFERLEGENAVKKENHVWRAISDIMRLTIACCIVVASQVSFMTTVRAEGNSPTDTPTPVVTDTVEEWSVGNGLIYWAYNCFADEFVSTAALKRKPVSGSIIRTLESIDDFTRCDTYLNQLSSADGLYYYDESQQRFERMPLGEPFAPQVIKPLTGNQSPVFTSPLEEANDYLYWIGFQQILRTLKDGNGPIETVSGTSSLIADMMIVGSTVYWIDNGGVKYISVDCAALPCSETARTLFSFNATTRGHGLVYQPPSGGPVLGQPGRVYWVARNTTSPTTYTIRYCPIGLVTPCQDPVVVPIGAAETASPTAFKTFYTASTDWFIGNPSLTNGNLYWTERDVSTVSNNTGDVKRKAITAADGDPADTIATNQANIDRSLYAANNLLFFARANTGIYSLALNASTITRDFEASGMEVTQAIQNLANDAPLIAGKSSYVRAYGRQLDGPSAPNVEARLFGTRNGNPLSGSPLQALDGVRALNSGGSFDRARLNDGWTFHLPGSWLTAGQVMLRLEIDGRQIHTDPNRTNNELSRVVTFQNQPPVCVWTVPVRTHTPLPSTTDPNFWSMVSHFNRRWPVPDTWIFRDTDSVEELQVCWAGPFPYPCHGPYELEDGWGITNGPPDRDKVIISLWGRALLSFNPDACDDISAPVHFMGMVHPEANNGGAAGYASTISNQSWVQLPAHLPNPVQTGWNMLREGSVMAQELAHNVGRKHIDCGGPDDVDGSYPYPPCQIADTGSESYYGFDVTTRQPIRPDETADFMSYANRSWVSDYTWRALMNSFAAVAGSLAEASAPAAEGESVFVTGLVDTENDRGEIATVLVLPAESMPPSTVRSLRRASLVPEHDDAPHATFKLRLLDAVGTVLVERTLTLIHMDDHVTDGASALFSDLFPQPADPVARIQLLADSTVIDEILPGPASPTVSVSQPTGGSTVDDTLTIAWTADDADPDDQLLFTVQYSHDGGTSWHTIALDYPSNPDKNYSLTLDDLGGLQGSGPNQALIRVLASDGYNTTIGTSQTFTVANRKPEPVILVPAADQVFAAGVAVPLSGRATDPEDGGLSSASLLWAVDGNAAGSGLDTNVTGLAPGQHAAALTATDSAANSASDSIDFSIAPLSIPLVSMTPTLDGSCDDESYSGGQIVSLKPYGDGAQATARVQRSDDHLWVCFSGLKNGTALPGAFAGLRVDVDHSRDALAQGDDYGFFVGEDGDVTTYAGDFTVPGPGGLVGQMQAGASSWSAELRIDRTILGGWERMVGLSLGHYRLNATDDDYVWPYLSAYSQPDSWAASIFGSQPLLTAIDPYTATVASAAFQLSVEGSGFISGTTAFWNGIELATTFVDDEHLMAQVGPAQIAAAGLGTIKTRAPDGLESNARIFVVEALAPIIDTLSPATLVAGSPATTITVNGDHFASDAQVLWNGVPLTTQFVNATLVKVQLGVALLTDGQTAGVAVRNQSPTQRISNAVSFEVTPRPAQSGKTLYLPVAIR